MPLSSDKHIVDQQIRKALHNYRAQPSGRVWNKVSQQLNTSDSRKSSRGKTLLLSAVLLATLGGLWIVSTNQSPKKVSYTVPANNLPGKINQEENANKLGTTSGPVLHNQLIAEAEPRHVLPATSCSGPSYQITTDEDRMLPDYAIIKSEETVFTFPDEGEMVPSSDRMNNADMEFMEPKHNSVAGSYKPSEKENLLKNYRYPHIVYSPYYYKANVKGAYVGFGQTLNSTWILDHEAISNKTMKYLPTFGTALMVQGGYNFSNRWGMEVAWVIHSGEGQEYKYLPVYSRTTSLVYYQKHVSFDYMQIPVMVRYKVQGWSGLMQVPFFVNYSLGVQYGRMTSYSIDETKEKVSNGHLFRRNEYAAVVSFDYDFLTRNAAFFTLGLRASMGSGLFIKDAPEDLEFDQPHNFLVGIHGAMNFSLQRKQSAEIK